MSFGHAFWSAEEGSTDFFGVVSPARPADSEEERGRRRGDSFMFWSVGERGVAGGRGAGGGGGGRGDSAGADGGEDCVGC